MATRRRPTSSLLLLWALAALASSWLPTLSGVDVGVGAGPEATPTGLLPADGLEYSAAVVPGSEQRPGLYRARLHVHNRGMDFLYTAIDVFLDFIQPEQLVPPGIELSVDGDLMASQVQTKWSVILSHYAGIASVALVGLLLALAVPVAGLVVCFCRCAGRCGANDEPFEKRRDRCKRVLLGILLGLLALLAAFGVICAFVSNRNVQDGIDELPAALRNAAYDTSVYFNGTRRAYATLLTTNYRELETAISKSLDESGRLVTGRLKQVTDAVAIDNLTAIVSNLGAIKVHLKEIENDTQILQDDVRRLQSGLTEVRTQVGGLMSRCADLAPCRELASQNPMRSLILDQTFVQMPDVQRMARNLSSLIANGVEAEVLRGRDALENVAFDVQRLVKDTLPKVKQQLRTAGQTLDRTAEEISMLLGRNIEYVNGPSIHNHIDTLQSYLDEYGPYRFYVGIAMAALVLVILLCFALGLTCGCYGKRPADPYDDEFGTKATGASCLMAGVGLLFMTSLLLMLLTTVHFLIGAFGEELSCKVLKNLGDDASGDLQQQEVHDFIDRILPLTQLYPHGVVKDDVVTVSNIVRECHLNRTLYETLQLERVLNVTSLEEMVRRMNIRAEVRRLADAMRVDTSSLVLLSGPGREQLRSLAASDLLSVNFSAYSAAMERDIGAVDLLRWASILNGTADQLQPYDAKAANILWNNSLYLEDLHASLLLPVRATSSRLGAAAAALEQRIRVNQSTPQQTIEQLVRMAERAQTVLRVNGTNQLRELAVDFGRECEQLIDGYVERVRDHMRHKIGKCGPLSQAYNATTGVVCQQIFRPFNGFWASIAWSMLLFLPCAALAIVLSSLYRKTDPYPGSLVETRGERRGMSYPSGGGGGGGGGGTTGVSGGATGGSGGGSGGGLGRAGHSYGHVYGYEDDYSYSQHQARSTSAAQRSAMAAASSTTNGGAAAASDRTKNGAGSAAAAGGAAPRYVASPVHGGAAAAATAAAALPPSAPLPDYPDRPPPYYYPGPAP